MKINPAHAIDFYKSGHKPMFPDNTEMNYANFTPRSDKHSKQVNLKDGNGFVVFFGLQLFIKDFLIESWNRDFFQQPLEEVLRKYKRRMDGAMGEGTIDIDHIEALHKLGYLPIKIKALMEGQLIPIKTPALTIVNTLPEFFWLTNYLESVISAEIWKPMTNATIAYKYRLLMEHYARKTGVHVDFVKIQGHDFSFRGMSGRVDAAVSGLAHLLSFTGTDCVLAIDAAEDYYGANSDREVVGVSIPATEHSVMCMGGKDDEIGTFRRLITEIFPSGDIGIVSDTWNLWKVLCEYVVELKPQIMAREGRVVFRPDSGCPIQIICGLRTKEISAAESKSGKYYADEYETDAVTWMEDGTRYYSRYNYDTWPDGTPTNFKLVGDLLLEAEVKGAVECLWDEFGGTINGMDCKVLDEHVGLIYGDSITLERCDEILSRLHDKGFASCNVVLGVGSYTYQYNTRDSHGMAMKATYGEVDGDARVIFKDPITDDGTKRSLRGLLRVNSDFSVTDDVTWIQENGGELFTVFEDGQLRVEHTLEDIRERLHGICEEIIDPLL
jgi:nicotinamide phosphoribosyltransferase